MHINYAGLVWILLICALFAVAWWAQTKCERCNSRLTWVVAFEILVEAPTDDDTGLLSETVRCFRCKHRFTRTMQYMNTGQGRLRIIR